MIEGKNIKIVIITVALAAFFFSCGADTSETCKMIVEKYHIDMPEALCDYKITKSKENMFNLKNKNFPWFFSGHNISVFVKNKDRVWKSLMESFEKYPVNEKNLIFEKIGKYKCDLDYRVVVHGVTTLGVLPTAKIFLYSKGNQYVVNYETKYIGTHKQDIVVKKVNNLLEISCAINGSFAEM